MYKIAIYKDVKDQLDINVLKEINSNQLYDLGQAQTISKEIRKRGGVSWIYENKYDKVNISYQEAEHKVFNFIENKENYSKTILKGLDTPIYYCFKVENYLLDIEPNFEFFYIDKLDGHFLTMNEVKDYQLVINKIFS
ncbi:hypothetical protein [uncultured Apibacter sp.]|uniref:hypothetical protein n=1 Tax=uncultured Apibacter sp. TaxID=1778616 RepID=UPI0025F23C7A|nr:hypothetical protein [uncultured Apibacter sp.]